MRLTPFDRCLHLNRLASFRGLASTGRTEEGNSLEDASLPLAQICKNILVSNWRGQLTFVDPTVSDDETKPHILSTLAAFVAPRGLLPPVVLLERGRNMREITNMRLEPSASLVVGRTDPVVLMRSAGQAGFRLPCISLYGQAREMTAGELAHHLRLADKAAARFPGFPTNWQKTWGPESTAAFALDLQTARYVDLSGLQHDVSIADLDGASVDPLAGGQALLLTSINSSPEWQKSMRLFCAAYMASNVGRVLMTQADRWGFTLLGQPHNASDGDPWQVHRLSFRSELKDTEAFMKMLSAMSEEAEGMVVDLRPEE